MLTSKHLPPWPSCLMGSAEDPFPRLHLPPCHPSKLESRELLTWVLPPASRRGALLTSQGTS